MKEKTLILDFEFTGLDNSYVKNNEIIQMKFINLFDKSFCIKNFSADKKSDAGAQVVHRIRNTNKRVCKFSKEEFLRLMPKDFEEYKIIGYSISMDKEMLRKYDIILNYSEDIQESAMLTTIGQRMAIEGRSMESLYYMLTKKFFASSHGGLDELFALKKIYYKIRKMPKGDILQYVPWGHCAGMPIQDYIQLYRRQADGHRYNNKDLFAKALDYFIMMDWSDDDGF